MTPRRAMWLGFAAIVALSCGCGRIDFAAMHAVPPDDARADAFVDPVGCSDGEREGFVDQIAFPRIAGCAATWSGTPSLRAPTLPMPCGDDLGACAAPAAACAIGWHLCGTSGDPAELTSRITAAQCLDAGGAPGTSFIAAMDHCAACDDGCIASSECHYAATYGCATTTYCAEAVCCGTMCGGMNMCRDGIYGMNTHTNRSNCGASLGSSADQTGVLCCADRAASTNPGPVSACAGGRAMSTSSTPAGRRRRARSTSPTRRADRRRGPRGSRRSWRRRCRSRRR